MGKRNNNYDDIIATAVVAAAGFGAGTAFAPGADIALCGGTWITMMVAIADRSGHEENNAFWGKVLASVGMGAAGYWAGSKIFTGLLFYVIPGAGSITAATLNALLNGLYTWRLGSSFANLFDKSGVDLRDVGAVASYLKGALAPIPTYAEVRHVWDIIREHL
jgi:uncharacterized protein (DUF697 family)